MNMSVYLYVLICIHDNMSAFALKGISVSGSHASLSLFPPTFLSAETQGEARVAAWSRGLCGAKTAIVDMVR